MILVAHSASSERDYFQTLGMDVSHWHPAFPSTSIERPADEAINVALQDGEVYIQDTQKLFAASGLPEAGSQVALHKVLAAMSIPARRLHNAGNDAYCEPTAFHWFRKVGIEISSTQTL